MLQEHRFITDFKENSPSFYVNYITDKTLSTVTFSATDIGETVQNLDLNKGRKHDNISIHMLKICGDCFCIPLEMFFKQAL